MKDKASDVRPPLIHIETAVIEEYGLNANAGWLYVVIVSHVNGKTSVAFPGLTRLAKLTGMSKPTVIKYIKVLENKGLIEVIREKVEGTNESEVNHYKVLPATTGSKADLPPSKEKVVKPVDNGSKTALPQVVKPVDSNQLESNQTELTDKSSAARARAPMPIEVGQILSLIKNDAPTTDEVKTALAKYRFEDMRDKLQKVVNNPKVHTPWKYVLAILEDELKLRNNQSSPSSSATVSPNGEQPETAVRRAQRQQGFIPDKKASGQ